MKPRMVRVEWIDSGMSRSEGWEDAQDIVRALTEEGSFEVVTIGWLIHEDDERIIVAQSHDTFNDAYYNAHAIYRPCVRSIRDLSARATLGTPRAA